MIQDLIQVKFGSQKAFSFQLYVFEVFEVLNPFAEEGLESLILWVPFPSEFGGSSLVWGVGDWSDFKVKGGD